jgi:hypothetical protein
MLDVVPFSRPECPNDHDDMGADCAAWWQAFNAVQTVQRMNETGESPEMRLCKACGQYHPVGTGEWYCPLDLGASTSNPEFCTLKVSRSNGTKTNGKP